MKFKVGPLPSHEPGRSPDVAQDSAPAKQLPYFQLFTTLMERGAQRVQTAFGRHVHWGFWPNPRRAALNASDFAAAAERLTIEICRAGDVADHQAILDVGCGFGGTVAYLNDTFSGMRL